MIGFIIRRLLSALLVLILTSMAVFTLFFLGPRNPAQPVCDAQQRCTPEKLANIEHSMGLDKPIQVAYAEWTKGLFVGRDIEFSTCRGLRLQCAVPRHLLRNPS